MLIGIRKKSSFVIKVSQVLEIPKNKNKNAGKQQKVAKPALINAPKRGIFFIALEKYMSMKNFLDHNNLIHLRHFLHKDNRAYL